MARMRKAMASPSQSAKADQPIHLLCPGFLRFEGGFLMKQHTGDVMRRYDWLQVSYFWPRQFQIHLLFAAAKSKSSTPLTACNHCVGLMFMYTADHLHDAAIGFVGQ